MVSLLRLVATASVRQLLVDVCFASLAWLILHALLFIYTLLQNGGAGTSIVKITAAGGNEHPTSTCAEMNAIHPILCVVCVVCVCVCVCVCSYHLHGCCGRSMLHLCVYSCFVCRHNSSISMLLRIRCCDRLAEQCVCDLLGKVRMLMLLMLLMGYRLVWFDWHR